MLWPPEGASLWTTSCFDFFLLLLALCVLDDLIYFCFAL
jgi:hypothetical protein